MTDRADMQAFMDYQTKINELLLQQNRQMQEFQNSMRQMIDERMRNGGGNGKTHILTKILFGVLFTLIAGITGYYVQENDGWKKEMRSDFNTLQSQVYDNTAMLKNSLTRIETILDNRYPEIKKK